MSGKKSYAGAAVAQREAAKERANHPHEHDICACSHMRRDHSGKTDKKRCTSKVIAMGQCDCVDFRMAKEARDGSV